MPYNPSITSFVGLCGIFGGINMVLGLVTWPLVAIVITRRFDPKYKTMLKEDMGLGCFLRGMWYATVMSSPKWLRRKKNVNNIIFKSRDLRAEATKFERWLACLHTYSTYLFLLMVAIFALGNVSFWIRHTFFE